MIRGGDTPKQETLWAIEFESGKFAFGHAKENEIVVETIPLGRKIWYADESGVIAGTTESVDEVVNTIIDTFNEHFGTDISHLSTETVLFNVGDKVYNWNAYEKINGLWGSFAVSTRQDNTTYFICVINGHEAVFQTKNNQMPFVSPEGKITVFGPTVQGVGQWCVEKITAQYGGSIISIESEETQLNVGDEISGWNNYTKINY